MLQSGSSLARSTPTIIRRTTISFRVSVPVLSVQMKVVDPSVSTAWSRRTIALRLAMRRTPSDSETVTIAGRPSGIAATASEIATSRSVVSRLRTLS